MAWGIGGIEAREGEGELFSVRDWGCSGFGVRTAGEVLGVGRCSVDRSSLSCPRDEDVVPAESSAEAEIALWGTVFTAQHIGQYSVLEQVSTGTTNLDGSDDAY